MRASCGYINWIYTEKPRNGPYYSLRDQRNDAGANSRVSLSTLPIVSGETAREPTRTSKSRGNGASERKKRVSKSEAEASSDTSVV